MVADRAYRHTHRTQRPGVVVTGIVQGSLQRFAIQFGPELHRAGAIVQAVHVEGVVAGAA